MVEPGPVFARVLGRKRHKELVSRPELEPGALALKGLFSQFTYWLDFATVSPFLLQIAPLGQLTLIPLLLRILPVPAG